MLNEIKRTCYDHESSGDRLNSQCRHSMQLKTMLGHKQGLLPDDFQSMMLGMGVKPNRCSHKSTSRPDLVNEQALPRAKHAFDHTLSSIKIKIE